MKPTPKLILCMLLLMLGISTYGQSNQEKALMLGREAVRLMDEGKIDESVKMLQDAQSLDPSNHSYTYEMAYAFYLTKDYKQAIKLLEKIADFDDASDRLFQLLGNCYDIVGKADKALKTYERGVRKFPDSGFLYLEQGVVHMMGKNIEKALYCFEEGIRVDPTFPSNYYWAAKLYCQTTEEVWGVMYGEIFLNLERNTARTAEISKLLYDTYKSEISFPTDTSASVSFCKHISVGASKGVQQDATHLPFELVYEPVLLLALANEREIDISSLDRIRSSFLNIYYQKEFDKSSPNVLFDFQKKIKDAGHLEAYNHWLLMKGEESSFEEWVALNRGKWNGFVSWFASNKLQIDGSNLFVRGE